jgi:protein-S-isoprenylcysteine O-methyltransferase Ste14
LPIKGFDKFREKLPDFSGKKIVILLIYAFLMIAAAFFVFTTFDSLPNSLATSGAGAFLMSFFPLFGVVVVEIVGLLLVWKLWFWRDKVKAKYGAIAYQRVFLVGFGGIIWIIAIAFSQYFPYYSFAQTFWASSPLQILATPLQAFLGVAGTAVFYLKDAVAGLLFVVGILMCTRAIQVFGFDYMVVLYMYFPEESQIQENEIYSVLRHPTYAGVLLICLGGAFFTFTFLSFAAYLIYLVGFYAHVHFVEEKELIQRFGDSCEDYRRKVPAFFVNPKKFRVFLRYLLK